MPLTINQVKSLRRKSVNEMKRSLKPVDTHVEKMQRMLQRLLDRKEKIIEEEELLEFADMWSEFRRIVQSSEKELAGAISAARI